MLLVSPHHRHSYWRNQTTLGNSSSRFDASFLPSWSPGNVYVARLGSDWSLMIAAGHYLIWVMVSAFCSNSTLSALSEKAISISPGLTFHYSCQCSKWITSHLKEHISLSYPLLSLMLVSQQGRFRKNSGSSLNSRSPLHWYMVTILILLKHSGWRFVLKKLKTMSLFNVINVNQRFYIDGQLVAVYQVRKKLFSFSLGHICALPIKVP